MGSKHIRLTRHLRALQRCENPRNEAGDAYKRSVRKMQPLRKNLHDGKILMRMHQDGFNMRMQRIKMKSNCGINADAARQDAESFIKSDADAPGWVWADGLLRRTAPRDDGRSMAARWPRRLID